MVSVSMDELTTTEVYGIPNLVLKKLSGHPTVYVWEKYYLSMISCMLFYSISRCMVLSVIFTAVATPVVNAGKRYIKHRRAYNDRIDCFAYSMLMWLRYPQQFNEVRRCIIYPPFRHFDYILVDTLNAALMRFDERCSAKDWDQVVKHIHRNPNALRAIYEPQSHLIERWELALMCYIPQKNSILQTAANRFL
ncbi:uncharacterized protein RHIMIDRAFT_243409 [Rhizopus microsporus ATCC 52813]|uniref:Uncharacterized protein n=1 Tax=Rhizopus microsporus ATCC 52813 TaxID=1340429 RepID=A0A2G4T8H6_RHIZD|nr:uncharacterized protein RHIMIDRAFT_243409 [Rhizopus microsporus ATCC 52813]PHZ17324.1 hypothetical protein RHIMIDRAFT_243409 [Rhizopus microsporus ATCC 52813]